MRPYVSRAAARTLSRVLHTQSPDAPLLRKRMHTLHGSRPGSPDAPFQHAAVVLHCGRSGSSENSRRAVPETFHRVRYPRKSCGREKRVDAGPYRARERERERLFCKTRVGLPRSGARERENPERIAPESSDTLKNSWVDSKWVACEVKIITPSGE